MKKAFFLGAYDTCVYGAKDTQVISLFPDVSYRLDKRGIRYSLLEYYYDERDLWADEKRYFSEQLDWFKNFDDFLKHHISYCRKHSIPLASANYLRIKYLVDAVLVECFILSRFFEKNSELEDIVYVYNCGTTREEHSVFDLKYNHKKVFGELLRLFCEKHNIHFSERFTERTEIITEDTPNEGFLAVLYDHFLKPHFKKILTVVRYDKFRKFLSQSDEMPGLPVLFLQGGSDDVDYPLKSLVKNGARVYVREHDRIVREDTFIRSLVNTGRLEGGFINTLKEECDACADNFRQDSSLIAWVNNKCSIDVSSVVIPFFKYFIAHDCFHILLDAERMYRFYRQQHVKYVFSRESANRGAIGSLIAAKYMGAAQSICLQHASFALDAGIVVMFESEVYNYNLTRDNITESYFKEMLKNKYSVGCNILQSPHYLRNVTKKYLRRKKKAAREKIMYVEKKFADRLRCINNITYPLVWYYEFQKKLIDYFAKESGFDFIYKHSKWQTWAENSILKYIDDMRCKRIRKFSGSFLRALTLADRVITDIPSGALFEAAIVGKPILCLCPDYFRVSEEGKRIFGKSLRQFSSINDAISIIKEFLNSDPSDYIVPSFISDADFTSVFKGMFERDKAFKIRVPKEDIACSYPLNYLVQDYRPDIDYGKGSVISLTGTASYDLGKAGVKYRPASDFYDESKLRSDEDMILAEEYDFFDKFDEILQKEIPYLKENGISLMRSHALRFKYIIDSFIMRARILKEVFKRVQHRSTGYVADDLPGTSLRDIYDSFDSNRVSFTGLVKALIQEKSDASISLLLRNKNYPKNESNEASLRSAIRQERSHRLRENTGTIQKTKRSTEGRRFFIQPFFKSIFNIIRYNKLAARFSIQRRLDGEKVLMLNAGSSAIDNVIERLIAEGATVFFKENFSVKRIDTFFEKEVLRLSGRKVPFQLPITTKAILKSFSEKTDFINWLNAKAGLDISHLVMPYFEYFFDHIVPAMLKNAGQLKSFYGCKDIGYVISRDCSLINSAEGLIAGSNVTNLRKVCFQHGTGAQELYEYLPDLDMFDQYFAMDSLSESYFKDLSSSWFAQGVHVFQSAHYLNQCVRWSRKRHGALKTVLYVPAKISIGMMYFNGVIYPTDWFYEFQKSLLDLFGTRDDYNFIWKYIYEPWQERSILRYIRDRNYPNVFAETGPLPTYLKKADRVIMDYPSTGLFEAACMGLPVFCVYRDTLKMRREAQDVFGMSLREISTIDEAIQAFCSFLDSDPERYIVKIPLKNDDFVSYLKEN
ncbi:MAG: hypothetical protein PHE61_03115 [Candidatus Omnitrophica bacterium]|nr:hypothetical protein [Candidatus Omnitrophota bacterium]